MPAPAKGAGTSVLPIDTLPTVLYRIHAFGYDEPMEDYKLICCDIDGTLLNAEQRISGRTKTAVAALAQKGISFALVSGRSPQSLSLLQEDLGIALQPLGCFNGALSLDEHGSLIDERPIDYTEAVGALDDLVHTELEFFLYTNHSWYVQERTSWYDSEFELTRIGGTIAPLRELQDHLDGREKPFKLLAMHRDSAYITKMTAQLQEHFFGKLNIFNSHPNYIELLPPDVDKGRSVRAFEARYNLDAKEVIAIGDYYNDIPMFQAVGLAVAMGNAPAEVQRFADRVIAPNSEDGLAQFLETLL